MRIIVVSAWEPWRLEHGGMLVLHHHLRRLASRHEILILAAGANARTATPPPSAMTLANTEWFGTSLPPALDWAARRVRGLATGEPAHVGYVERPALIDALQAHKADLIYAVGWGTAGLHRHVGATPVVHAAIDPWELGFAGRALPAWRRIVDVGERSAVMRHERRHYPKLSAVTVVADDDADHLRRAIPAATIEVVPNGVEPGPPPVDPPARPTLGFHGNFESVHNVEGATTLAREIWPAVRASRPDARVLIAGLHAADRIGHLGGEGVEIVTDPAEMRPLLDRMSVEVVWLSSGTGVKNKILEAMAAARPVIADAGAAAGIGAGDGLLVADSPVEGAAAVLDWLSDPAALAAAGRAARERVVAEHGWPASADRLEQVWRRAAGQS